MKKIILITIIMLFTLSSFSQETIKYRDDANSLIEFNISTNEYLIKVDKSQKSALQKSNLISNITEIYDNLVLIKSDYAFGNFSNGKSELSQRMNYNTSQIEPVLIYKDGIRQVCNGEVIIKVTDDTVIEKLFSNYTVEITPNKLVENQFTIKIADINTFEILDLVSQLQNHSKIDFIEPNFIRFLKPHTNDQFLSSQWSINNQGYLGGTVDADMDVDDAWSISTGTNIKVAVIDEGVDLTHPDLTANLLNGYDATDGNSNGAPNTANDDGHGTSCAGIIGAVANNTNGIAGVAYNAKIIPVRIAYSNGEPLYSQGRAWITNNNWIADGITWAYQNGADILSNSWGGGSPSTAITYAINNAVNNGRNGKGCTVLFSSGNYNTDVAYPATLSNVIAVGASSMCDERKTPTSCDGEYWWGSNFGDDIDVVAPGVKIYTTDISGSDGYSTGDYKSDFNGTSSACPNAAGVAALVLAVNPDFTQTQVREILEKTTDKIGDYDYSINFQSYNGTTTWNNEVGFGRLNALSAVQMAVGYDGTQNHYIVGPTQLTPGLSATYNLEREYIYATNYVWTIPSGCHYNYCWGIVNGQGTSQLRIKAGSTGVQDITCKVYNGSTMIGNHYITVNVQNPYNGGGSGDDPCGGLEFTDYVIYPPDPCDNGNMNSTNSTENVFENVVIYNMYGQVVFKSNDKRQVNISHLSSGIYIIKALLSNNELYTKKIYKM